MNRETETVLVDSVAVISKLLQNMDKIILILDNLQKRVEKLETKNFWRGE